MTCLAILIEYGLVTDFAQGHSVHHTNVVLPWMVKTIQYY